MSSSHYRFPITQQEVLAGALACTLAAPDSEEALRLFAGQIRGWLNASLVVLEVESGGVELL